MKTPTVALIDRKITIAVTYIPQERKEKSGKPTPTFHEVAEAPL
jgi:hypothetical protein